MSEEEERKVVGGTENKDLNILGITFRNITNGNFQLFTRHSSAHSARSRLCFTAGVSTINEGIKHIHIDLFLPKRGETRGLLLIKVTREWRPTCTEWEVRNVLHF